MCLTFTIAKSWRPKPPLSRIRGTKRVEATASPIKINGYWIMEKVRWDRDDGLKQCKYSAEALLDFTKELQVSKYVVNAREEHCLAFYAYPHPQVSI